MLPGSLGKLVQLLTRLPGVGEKTAQRYALYLIGEGGDVSTRLGQELLSLAERIRPCEACGNIAELDQASVALCDICRDSRREEGLLCVVARVQDLIAIEKSGAMRGRYFVLGKLLSPLDGIGPEDIPISQLKRRIQNERIQELLVATPPSVDGEATALLLSRELSEHVRLTRIASGVPHGGDLEFADRITLGRAIDGRRNLD